MKVEMQVRPSFVVCVLPPSARVRKHSCSSNARPIDSCAALVVSALVRVSQSFVPTSFKCLKSLPSAFVDLLDCDHRYLSSVCRTVLSWIFFFSR